MGRKLTNRRCGEDQTDYSTKKSAKRKTNLKMTAYERDEKRTRMRMNKIMG